MNLNNEIKELKKEIVQEMIGSLLKGKLDKTSGIVMVCGLFVLEMADAYTTVHPLEIPLINTPPKIRLNQARAQLQRRRRRRPLTLRDLPKPNLLTVRELKRN
jgi:hypothetical protein